MTKGFSDTYWLKAIRQAAIVLSKLRQSWCGMLDKNIAKTVS